MKVCPNYNYMVPCLCLVQLDHAEENLMTERNVEGICIVSS
jgi:hypothetical protein